MSEAKTLNDLLKSLPTATYPSGQHVLIADAQGVLSRISRANLSGIVTGFNVTGFANVLNSLGIYLCAVYSESDRFINCLFVVFMVKKDAVKNLSPHYVLGSSGGLILSACNAFGTLSFKMSDGSAVPSDLVLKYMAILS